MLPRRTLVRQFDAHRLIPSKYADETALTRIADDDAHLKELFRLELATNDRVLAEHQQHAGIGVDELVFNVPYAHIVNASFCHPHPLGSRFNGPDRGCWYAGFDLATSQTEIAFHKSIELAEVGWQDESILYDDYLADFSAELHDLRNDRRFTRCLAPDSYVASQALAQRLLDAGALGVVYPSVRHDGGTCLGCFRPALVVNVRKDQTYRFTWSGDPIPVIEAVRPPRASRLH